MISLSAEASVWPSSQHDLLSCALYLYCMLATALPPPCAPKQHAPYEKVLPSQDKEKPMVTNLLPHFVCLQSRLLHAATGPARTVAFLVLFVISHHWLDPKATKADRKIPFARAQDLSPLQLLSVFLPLIQCPLLHTCADWPFLAHPFVPPAFAAVSYQDKISTFQDKRSPEKH